MTSLHEIFDFVGITDDNKYNSSQGADHAIPPDPAMKWFGSLGPQPTMKWVAAMVPVLSGNERGSLREMSIALWKLPSIGLIADGQDLVDEVPFAPAVHVGATIDFIYETTCTILRNATPFPDSNS